MSKWVEIYKSHDYKKSWDKLKEVISTISIDDDSIRTSVEELTRLTKVVDYLDGLIEELDPELTPINIWDNFKSQTDATLDQVNNFVNNRSIDHLSKANQHADNLLTYIRPYMVLPKSAASAVTSAVNKQVKNLESFIINFDDFIKTKLEDIKEAHTTVSNILEQINKHLENAKSFEADLFGDEGFKIKLESLLILANEQSEAIENFHAKLFVNEDDELSIKAKVNQASEDINTLEEKAKNLVEAIKDKQKEISRFYSKVVGEESEEGKPEGGLKSELNLLFARLKDFEVEQKDRTEALNKQVESLLPGATSAGLAYKFRSLRKSFGVGIKTYSRIFYGSVIALFIVSFLFITKDVGFFYIKFEELSDFGALLKNSVYKLALIVPVLWLAVFASKRRSEFHRLEQEYAHKEAVAASYQSFKKQIELLNEKDTELMHRLLNVVVTSLSYNASVTLDGKHGDNTPLQEVIESTIRSAVGKETST